MKFSLSFLQIISVVLILACSGEKDYFMFNVTNKHSDNTSVDDRSAIAYNASVIIADDSVSKNDKLLDSPEFWLSDDVYVSNAKFGEFASNQVESTYSIDESYYQTVLSGLGLFFHENVVTCVVLFFRPLKPSDALQDEYYIESGSNCARKNNYISWFADNTLNEILTGIRITSSRSCNIDGISAWSSPVYNSPKNGILSDVSNYLTDKKSDEGVALNLTEYVGSVESVITGVVIYGDFESNSCALEMDVKSREVIREIKN